MGWHYISAGRMPRGVWAENYQINVGSPAKAKQGAQGKDFKRHAGEEAGGNARQRAQAEHRHGNVRAGCGCGM